MSSILSGPETMIVQWNSVGTLKTAPRYCESCIRILMKLDIPPANYLAMPLFNHFFCILQKANRANIRSERVRIADRRKRPQLDIHE